MGRHLKRRRDSESENSDDEIKKREKRAWLFGKWIREGKSLLYFNKMTHYFKLLARNELFLFIYRNFAHVMWIILLFLISAYIFSLPLKIKPDALPPSALA